MWRSKLKLSWGKWRAYELARPSVASAGPTVIRYSAAISASEKDQLWDLVGTKRDRWQRIDSACVKAQQFEEGSEQVAWKSSK